MDVLSQPKRPHDLLTARHSCSQVPKRGLIKSFQVSSIQDAVNKGLGRGIMPPLLTWSLTVPFSKDLPNIPREDWSSYNRILL